MNVELDERTVKLFASPESAGGVNLSSYSDLLHGLRGACAAAWAERPRPIAVGDWVELGGRDGAGVFWPRRVVAVAGEDACVERGGDNPFLTVYDVVELVRVGELVDGAVS